MKKDKIIYEKLSKAAVLSIVLLAIGFAIMFIGVFVPMDMSLTPIFWICGGATLIPSLMLMIGLPSSPLSSSKEK